MTFQNYIKLIRVQQWYKNLVVFLAIFFSANILNTEFLVTTLLAFISLSFISSAGYIINDLRDVAKDRLHPIKKYRPLAAGTIKTGSAIILLTFLLAIGLFIAWTITPYFLYAAFTLFLLTQLYTFFLKKIFLADVITIATLFVIRAIAGAFAIDVVISPWLVLVPFFLSLFLSVSKRHTDVTKLKEKATHTKEVLKEYTSELTNTLMTVYITLLILSYTLYSFLSPFNNLLYTLPFALFTIFRTYALLKEGFEIVYKPETIIKDKPILIGTLLWIITTATLIYM